jgi:hypothetical protein
LAASLAVQAHRKDLTQISSVAQGRNTADIWARQDSKDWSLISINIKAGANTPIEQNTQQWSEISQQRLDARNEQLAQELQQSQGISMRR